MRDAAGTASGARLIDLDEIPAETLIELGQLRLKAEREARERRVALAMDLLFRPTIGHYRRQAKQPQETAP